MHLFGKLILLTLGSIWIVSPGYGSEWQTLREGTHRITAPESSEPEPEKMTEVPLPEGHYDPGQGDIDGAFGVSFGAPIDKSWVSKRQGWTTPPSLPADLAYRGLVQPLIIENVLIAPPVEPPQLAAQEVHYSVYLDFDGLPMSISTSAFKDAEPIIEIIARKYGEPDEVDGKRSTYIRGDHRLHIYSKHQSSAQLVYEDVAAYRSYLKERNLSLKRKFRNREQDRLAPNEKEVVDLAAQLATFREGEGEAFGLEFGRRVGFRAEPDEFVPFDAPTPLTSFDSGQYKIMVSPDLMPIAVRYQLTGQSKKLAATKYKIELAMDLAFAGFLKQTPRHTVLSFNQHAYSLLIRNGQFNFTVHDRAENSAHNDRVKEAKIAAAEAKKERKRLAELERQRQEIAARQKQIAEEKAF